MPGAHGVSGSVATAAHVQAQAAAAHGPTNRAAQGNAQTSANDNASLATSAARGVAEGIGRQFDADA